jgi:hypothetical protein
VDATNQIIPTNFSTTWEDWNERCLGQDSSQHVPSFGLHQRDPSKITHTTNFREAVPTEVRDAAEDDEQALTSSMSIRVRNVDFSDHRQKHYKMAWNFYQDDLKPLEKQQDPITKMKA